MAAGGSRRGGSRRRTQRTTPTAPRCSLVRRSPRIGALNNLPLFQDEKSSLYIQNQTHAQNRAVDLKTNLCSLWFRAASRKDTPADPILSALGPSAKVPEAQQRVRQNLESLGDLR